MASVLNNEARNFIIKARKEDKIVTVYLKPQINFITDEELELLKTAPLFVRKEQEGSFIVANQQGEDKKAHKAKVEDVAFKKTKKAK